MKFFFASLLHMIQHRGNLPKTVMIGVIIATIFSWACSKKEEAARPPEARELYLKSVAILHAYIDSTQVVKDSLHLQTLSENFDKSITKLNYSYPPEMDLAVSEGENDTLIRLTLKYIQVRDSAYYRLAHPTADIHDSVSQDTTDISQLRQSNSRLNT